MGGLYFQIWHKLSMLIDLSSSVSQLLNYHSLTHEPVLSMLFPTDAVECTTIKESTSLGNLGFHALQIPLQFSYA